MSYADLAYYKTYMGDRGVDVTAQADADITSSLLNATEYMDDQWDYVGVRVVESQDNKWPRSSAYNSEGILLTSLEIPTKVKDACCELAYLDQTETGGLSPVFNGKVVKRQKNKLGVLEQDTEYDSGASEAYTRFYAKAYSKIKDLIINSSNSSVRLQRVI
jgi:hypothetical protein